MSPAAITASLTMMSEITGRDGSGTAIGTERTGDIRIGIGNADSIVSPNVSTMAMEEKASAKNTNTGVREDRLRFRKKGTGSLSLFLPIALTPLS